METLLRRKRQWKRLRKRQNLHQHQKRRKKLKKRRLQRKKTMQQLLKHLCNRKKTKPPRQANFLSQLYLATLQTCEKKFRCPLGKERSVFFLTQFCLLNEDGWAPHVFLSIVEGIFLYSNIFDLFLHLPSPHYLLSLLPITLKSNAFLRTPLFFLGTPQSHRT